MRGYAGIGVYHPKAEVNIGTLVRSARAFDAAFVFTIGRRYGKQKSSTSAERHIPVLHYEDDAAWRDSMPTDAELVAVEVGGPYTLETFVHPERAVYLLGPEDGTLPESFLSSCQVVSIPTRYCLNVSTAGSIVLYDRAAKRGKR